MMRTALLAALLTVPITAAVAQDRLTPREREMIHRLETTPMTMDFQNTPLEEVLDFMRSVTRVDIVIDPAVLREPADERRVTLKVRDLPALHALRLLLGLLELDYTLRNGVVLVANKDEARGRTYTKVYDIRDLMFEIRDFPGPEISLADARGEGGQLGAEFFLPDHVDQGDDITQPEVVMEIIEENVAPGSWDREDVGMKVVGGHLVVRQLHEVQLEVERMLDMLRAHK